MPARAPGFELNRIGTAGIALVADFKTTSNLAYAKTSTTLATDVQAQLYATAVMFEDERDVVDLVWFTARTRRPHRAQRAHLRVDGAHVVEQFQRIDAIGRELVAIKLARAVRRPPPPNPRMCDQYGGCPHRHRCNLSPPVHAEAWNHTDEDSGSSIYESSNFHYDFMASLRKNVAAAPAPTFPPRRCLH